MSQANIDNGDEVANNNAWSNLLGRVGNALGNRLSQEIDPPKVDSSPVATTTTISMPARQIDLSLNSPLVLVGLAVVAFIAYRHFTK